MSGLVGYRLTNPETGLDGIIVSARSIGTWRGDAIAYDVIWSDRSCSLKVSMDKMAEAGWQVGERKVSREECNRLWCDYQVERARRLEKEHVRDTRPVRAPIVVNRQVRMSQPNDTNVVRMDPRRFASTAGATSSDELLKPASWHARRLLAHAMPGVNFALSVDRKKLAVGWIDGPAPQRVENLMSALLSEGRIERMSARRGANIGFVQAAIAMVLARVWGSDVGPTAQSDRLRVSASDYLAGSMPSVMTPLSSPIGTVPYAHLIRCLMEGWDFELGRFIEVERTRYLRQEVSFLFPAGLEVASDEFQRYLGTAQEQVEANGEIVNALPQLDRARG